MEERTEQQIQVRQVTHVQASWTEQERGAPGAFTLQLILDNGADEYVLRTTAEDTDVLLKLFERSHSAIFDVTRKKLLQMAWFKKVYEFIMAMRAKAAALVQPIKLRIREILRGGGDSWSSRTLRLIARFRKSVHEAR